MDIKDEAIWGWGKGQVGKVDLGGGKMETVEERQSGNLMGTKTYCIKETKRDAGNAIDTHSLFHHLFAYCLNE